MARAKEKHEPVRQSVHVDCAIDDAFRLFTEDFGKWWPLASHSIAGDGGGDCVIEPWVGGRVFERTRSGEESDWGEVIHWDSPERVEFTWHPGRRGDRSETVNVEFLVEADGTRVTLIHTGWDAAGVSTCFARFVAEQMLVAV